METTAIRLMRPITAIVQGFAGSTELRERDAYGSVLQEWVSGLGLRYGHNFTHSQLLE